MHFRPLFWNQEGSEERFSESKKPQTTKLLYLNIVGIRSVYLDLYFHE